MGRGLVRVAVAALLVAGACTGSPDPEERALPPTADAADAFVAAWTDRDFEAMAEMFANPDADGSTPEELRRWFERQLDRGAVTSFSVGRAGRVEQPVPDEDSDSEELAYDGVVEVPFGITYVSEGSEEPVNLDGTFDIVFEGGEWKVEWDRSLAWPGITGARRFDVTYRWPRRAPILDRGGRTLARGNGRNRRYPFGSLAGSTIGHLGTRTRGDLGDAPDGRSPGDFVGASGLEAAFEEQLAGTPGATLVVRGRGASELEEFEGPEPRRGRPLRTTLDVDVQRAAEAGYGATTGGAAVVVPRTGDILALVDSSRLDPNNYVGASGVAPFNRAVAGRYPPGSAMKVVTAAAALDSGVVSPSSTVTGPGEYQGVRNFESGQFGTITFATATRFSVNTAFAQVAEKLGSRRLSRYAERFGFNKVPAMPLEAAEPSFPEPKHLGDLMWASIGQAQVLSTPLHMATVAATIANGGRRMEPRISRRDPVEGERVITRRTARQMRSMMEDVVRAGTGTGAALAGTTVAGKTGTAEVDVAGERRNHAWFVAFAPSRSPRVAVAVVAEYGGVGGRVAAPLARAILQGVLPVAP